MPSQAQLFIPCWAAGVNVKLKLKANDANHALDALHVSSGQPLKQEKYPTFPSCQEAVNDTLLAVSTVRLSSWLLLATKAIYLGANVEPTDRPPTFLRRFFTVMRCDVPGDEFYSKSWRRWLMFELSSIMRSIHPASASSLMQCRLDSALQLPKSRVNKPRVAYKVRKRSLRSVINECMF